MAECPRNVLVVGNHDTGKKYLCTVFMEEKPIIDHLTENPNYHAPEFVPQMKWIEVGCELIPVHVQTMNVEKDATIPNGTLSYLVDNPADVVLLCFSVCKPDTLISAVEDCLPVMKQYCPRAPIVLVGTNLDSRLLLENKVTVSTTQGIRVAKAIGAYHYVECCAYTNFKVLEVFQTAVRATFNSDSMDSSVHDLTLTGGAV